MELRHCYYCNQDKPLDQFYIGHISKRRCKRCVIEMNYKWRRIHPERYRELARIEARKKRLINPEAYREKAKIYGKLHYAKIRNQEIKRVKDWRENNPQKFRAHILITLLVSTKQIIPPKTCGICSIEIRLDAHHLDYAKPLEVIWLCRSCHRYVHSGYKQIPQSLINKMQRLIIA